MKDYFRQFFSMLLCCLVVYAVGNRNADIESSIFQAAFTAIVLAIVLLLPEAETKEEKKAREKEEQEFRERSNIL